MIMNSNRTSALSRLWPVSCLLLFVAAAIAVTGAIGSSRANNEGRVGALRRPDTAAQRSYHAETGKIAPWVIEHTANGQQPEFFVVLTEQADLRGAATLATKAEKGRYVYDALWNKRQITQRPILQWLRERGIEHRSFYVV